MTYLHSLKNCILHIEERLNSYACQFADTVNENHTGDWQNRIDEALTKRRSDGLASDYVLKLLPQRGFAYPDGQPNCSKFYKHARISPDVWSTFLSHRHKSSYPTLFKIVIGLRMNEAEAREFLALSGSGFSNTDLVHKIILACIDCGYYDPDLVYEILEFYRPPQDKGGDRYHNIYGDP